MQSSSNIYRHIHFLIALCVCLARIRRCLYVSLSFFVFFLFSTARYHPIERQRTLLLPFAAFFVMLIACTWDALKIHWKRPSITKAMCYASVKKFIFFSRFICCCCSFFFFYFSWLLFCLFYIVFFFFHKKYTITFEKRVI